MFIPAQAGGYFNMQKSSTPAVEWAFEVFIGEEGWHIVGGDTTFFDYPLDVWNKFNLTVDLDEISATLLLNNNIIQTWNWNLTANGFGGINQVGALNIFAGSPLNLPSLYYVDDITAIYTPLNLSLIHI